MKDALGREVSAGDILFITSGSYKNVHNGFAIVINPDTAQIKSAFFKQDLVYDEPGYTYQGDRDDKYGYYNDKKERRKHHFESQRYEFGSSSNLKLGFSRSVVIDPIDIQGDDLLKEFLISRGF